MQRRALVTLPVWLLAGCAGLGGPPTLVLSQAELQSRVQAHFPLQQRVLDMLDVSLLNPRLQLLPEQQRLAAVLDLRARERLLAGTWQGQLSFDAALRWSAADQTLRLAQVRVQDLALRDPDGPTRSLAERVGAVLTERALEGLVVYKLAGERWLELQRRGLELGRIEITPRGVEVQFVRSAAAPR
jgi:hypothetical protein